MIIEFEINGARVIVSGENLSVSVTQDGAVRNVEVAGSAKIQVPTPEDIISLRAEMNCTQAQLAGILRVNQGMISKWENGVEAPNGENAIKLASMIGTGIRQPVEGIDALRLWLKERHGRGIVLADGLGITPQAVSQWSEIPYDKIIAIESITGISRRVLRPEIYAE